jgi:hypothetical protein
MVFLFLTCHKTATHSSIFKTQYIENQSYVTYVVSSFPFENADTMGERMGRIGRIRTDLLDPNARISSKKAKKKSVRIRPIRPIRSPIVSAFSNICFPKKERACRSTPLPHIWFCLQVLT